jgi:vancomycin resistance protein YoaR
VGLQTKPSRDALPVDMAASLHRLIDYVSSANPSSTITLAVKTSPPRVRQSALEKIDGVLAEFVTHYNPGDRARTQNVRLVTEHLNGGIALPGETFSFNGKVGKRDPKEGYRIAHVYVQGKMIEDVGGGTCQVSSTLYNSVLLAGLPIVERSNHSLTVPYVKPGRDATVYFGQKDFKFKNNTSAPIYIRAIASGGGLTISLYGQKKAGPQIKIVSASHRKGDKIYASAYRLFIADGKVVRREHLSSDSYIPLALAVKRAKAPAPKHAAPVAAPPPATTPTAEAVQSDFGG